MTESSLQNSTSSLSQSAAHKSHMGEMFAFHSSTMADTLSTPIIVFTRTGSMAIILSHNRPSSTIFAFTNNERVKQRLALYHGVVPLSMEFSADAEETFSELSSFYCNSYSRTEVIGLREILTLWNWGNEQRHIKGTVPRCLQEFSTTNMTEPTQLEQRHGEFAMAWVLELI
ncbi:hypothetical protein HAX54_014106 [Datura stramonium]|uniref:Pyruvate kinase C-terminal domain-containing protein n=1 Tax=Datura stramonium TaxID=4076 RepID=A0ABS8RYN1_DATST|nr:hypothetical protein [Datura stramonium]